MLSILSVLKDKSLWLIGLTIIGLFIIVPYSIFSFSYIIFFLVVITQIVMLVYKLPGVVIISFAYSLMIPYTSSHIGTGATNYTAYFSVAICCAFLLLKQTRLPYGIKLPKKILLALVSFSLYFSLLNSNSDEFKIFTFYIISTFGCYYLAFQDKTTLKQFYGLFDIIFYITVFFTGMEFFFKSSPYQILYDEQLIDIQIRAKGLLGSPLVLSAITSFYFIVLLSKNLLFKKTNILGYILVILILVITASKTSFALVSASALMYLLYLSGSAKVRILVSALLLVLVSILVFPSQYEFLETPIDRIQASTIDQRVGSYSVSFDVFANNPFGIGLSRGAFESEIGSGKVRYHFDSSYDTDFLVFDNMYLTSLVGLGIFFFLMFPIYFKPILYVKSKVGKTSIYYKILLITLISWILLNFSFDSYAYFPINSFFFIFSALIIKEMNSNRLPKNIISYD